MSDLRGLVETVVLVMMENRSFDHMLGHLSLERINTEVDGLRRPLKQHENLHQGDTYNPYRMKDGRLPFDLPHEHTDVAVQLKSVRGHFTMGGFVEAYAAATGTVPNPHTEPMGYFPSDQVPISSFLARNFATCDRWFSALPTSTQPNRTIAFCGATRIFDTKRRLIPCDDTIFDWLNRAGVRWRVYHDGLSFFALYPRAWPHVLGPDFRDFEFFHLDRTREAPETAPQVILVEPSYEDAPHIGPDHPNDNHAPLAVGWGEEFLRRTYEAVTADRDRWAKTVMVVYYDEHGGFWDHVPPPALHYEVKSDPPHVFEHLGPRIPGIVISPLVESGAVCHTRFDHTSVLQFLAELFTPGVPYSSDVEARADQGIESVSAAVTRETPRADVPIVPAVPIRPQGALGTSVATAPTGGMGQAFELAAKSLLEEEPAAVGEKYPELFAWRAAADAARNG